MGWVSSAILMPVVQRVALARSTAMAGMSDSVNDTRALALEAHAAPALSACPPVQCALSGPCSPVF